MARTFYVTVICAALLAASSAAVGQGGLATQPLESLNGNQGFLELDLGAAGIATVLAACGSSEPTAVGADVDRNRLDHRLGGVLAEPCHLIAGDAHGSSVTEHEWDSLF